MKIGSRTCRRGSRGSTTSTVSPRLYSETLARCSGVHYLLCELCKLGKTPIYRHQEYVAAQAVGAKREEATCHEFQGNFLQPTQQASPAYKHNQQLLVKCWARDLF